jgi:hypothetical protein
MNVPVGQKCTGRMKEKKEKKKENNAG